MEEHIYKQRSEDLNVVFNDIVSDHDCDFNHFEFKTILSSVKKICSKHSMYFSLSSLHLYFKMPKNNIEILIDIYSIFHYSNTSGPEWTLKYIEHLDSILTRKIEPKATFIYFNGTHPYVKYLSDFDFIYWSYSELKEVEPYFDK